jgi:hypothetical protein
MDAAHRLSSIIATTTNRLDGIGLIPKPCAQVRILPGAPASLHGHVHDSWLQVGRQINVSLDAWGGRITNSDEVVTMIDSGPRDLPRIDWPT